MYSLVSLRGKYLHKFHEICLFCRRRRKKSFKELFWDPWAKGARRAVKERKGDSMGLDPHLFAQGALNCSNSHKERPVCNPFLPKYPYKDPNSAHIFASQRKVAFGPFLDLFPFSSAGSTLSQLYFLFVAPFLLLESSFKRAGNLHIKGIHR